MKKTFILIGFLCILLVAVLGGYVAILSRPVDVSQTSMQDFVVPRGQSTARIATRLQEDGLIRSELIFRFIVRKQRLTGSLQAGSFELSPSMTPTEIALAMTQGSNDIWVTIPEGWRREQIADSLSDQKELPEFNRQEFEIASENLEGRLFPDTYLFAKESTADTIVSFLTHTFDTKVIEGLADEIAAADHSFEESLIMASIVEREARGYEEMRHVAGILWNRYEMDMPLQTDATLQYILGYDQQTQAWWSPPTAADKQLQSPYNTYLHVGLPPHPISNPGLDAIRAALNPLSTQDLYYLHDRDGAIHYGRTFEEHNANVQKYLR